MGKPGHLLTRHRVALSGLAAAVASVALGCGVNHGSPRPSGVRHTYIVALTTSAQRSWERQGVGGTGYVTIISPVRIHADVFPNSMRFVARKEGRQVCSYQRPFDDRIEGAGKYLRGTTVTLKVNGSGLFAKLTCFGFRHGSTYVPDSTF